MENIGIGIITGIIITGIWITIIDFFFKTRNWKEDIENDIYQIQEDINKLFKNKNI